MKNNKYIIDTRYNHVNKLIFLNEPSKDAFLEECKKAFKIKIDDARIHLTTNTGASIPENSIDDLIKAAGSYFAVNLYVCGKNEESSLLVPNDIKQYLIDKNATVILDENERGTLTDKSRRLLIRHLNDYQTERFGENPNKGQKDAIATAASCIFTTLSVDVIKGFCTIQAANKRAALKKSKPKRVVQSESDSVADVAYLKTLPVNTENLPTIKAKLVATQAQRWKMMDTMEIDLLEWFPYFFAHPDLVLFDFKNRFKAADDNAFLDEWPNLRKRLNTILVDHYKSGIQTLWPKEIQDLLILLKLVRPKASKNAMSVMAFNKATNKLIVFRKSDVPLDKLSESSNDHPYIIAVGDTIDDITHYYIELEKHLMPVPSNYGIAETFDLFLKVHEAIGLRFEQNIQPMAYFCLHFIYGVKKLARASPLLKNLRDRMKEIET